MVVKDRETERQLLKLPKSLDDGIPFVYRAPYTGGGIVRFEFRTQAEQATILPLLRTLLKKVSACVGCQSCEADCNVGAINIKDGKLKIDGEKCIKCRGCYEIKNACWRYRSMYKPENSSSMANVFAQYNNFGLREAFVDALLERGDTFFHWDSTHPIGDKKVDSTRKWFPQALIVTEDRKPTKVVELFKVKGTSCEIAWEFVWMALVNNSPLINWYCVSTEIDDYKDVQSLLESLQESYPLANNAKDRRLDALKNTADASPLGGESNAVMLPEYKGSRVVALTRKAKDVESLTILYGLYLIANLAERGSFTVRELLTADADSAFVSPIVAFGIAPYAFKKQCEGLRTRYPDYISTTFTHGNDGLEIYPYKHSLEDIINLALGE
jgi:ferredoxin